MIKNVWSLLKKDFLVEWRQKFSFYGVLLYVFCTVYIVYIGMRKIPALSWISLFWIILLFIAVNSISRSFMAESKARMLYYYSIVSPHAILLSKIIYAILQMLLLGSITMLLFSVFNGNPIQDMKLFLLSIGLGSIGLAVSLTMISGISFKAQNSNSLMAILGFPVLIPILTLSIKLSKNALDGLSWSASIDEIQLLVALNLIVFAVAFILFPFVWRE